MVTLKAVVEALLFASQKPLSLKEIAATLTAAAESRLPGAIAVLFAGNHDALQDFTEEEVGLLVALLTRLIANLDRVAAEG